MQTSQRVAWWALAIGVAGGLGVGSVFAVAAFAEILDEGSHFERQRTAAVADTNVGASQGASVPAAEDRSTAAEASVNWPPIYDASTDISTVPRPDADRATAYGPGEVETWLAQQEIIADCMLAHGYDYQFTPSYLYPIGTPARSYGENWGYDVSSAKGVALWAGRSSNGR